MRKNDETKNVLIWGEHINIKDFLIAILIQLVLLVVVFFIKVDKDLKLILGLISIVIGFTINVIRIKPKRNLEIVEGDNQDV